MTTKIMMIHTFVVWGSLFALGYCRQQDQVALKEQQPSSDNLQPSPVDYIGVGFDFSSQFVTAAVSFPNETIVVIEQLLGNDDYLSFMKHVSLESSKHLAPPYNDLGEWYKDHPRQAWRKFLRSMGLPSCEEARVIASMIKPLKDAVENRLGHPITHAQASFPPLVALYAEDVWDAFEYVGLIFQEFYLWEKIAPDFSVNYASQGRYLCKNYKDPVLCAEERKKLDSYEKGEFSTFNFHLSDEALYLSIPMIRSPYSFNKFSDCHFEDANLGLKAPPDPSETPYWELVESRIADQLERCKFIWDNQEMHDVFITGRGAGLPEFVGMVKRESLDKGIDVKYTVDKDGHIGARGAAEVAKRDRYMYPDRPHPRVD